MSRWGAGAIHRCWCCQGVASDAEGAGAAEAGVVGGGDGALGPAMTACALVPMKAKALTPQRMASVLGSGRGPYLDKVGAGAWGSRKCDSVPTVGAGT